MVQPQQILSVDLSDRTLWVDGVSSFKEPLLEEALYSAHRTGAATIFVTDLSKEIRNFNQMSSKKMILRDPSSVMQLAPVWAPEVTNIDIAKAVMPKLEEHLLLCPEDAVERRERVASELLLFTERGLDDVLRACIFIVNTLTAKNVVWGVGRGSAVASYVLYLIGVHDVDSVKYKLDIHEFLGEDA